MRQARVTALLGFGWALLVAGAGLAAQPAADEQVSRARIDAALEQVRPALVNLSVVSRHFADGRMVRYPSAGSGVIVTADGVLLTNYHVAGNSVRIQATLSDGRVLEADVVAHDPLTDLSVLRLQDGAAHFQPARFADSPPEVGEPVLALGNPLTLSSSVTLGIISNARRVFTDFTGTDLEDLDVEGEPTGLFTQWIQHDALILPGNSGGPLVDLAGRIVGINELGGNGIGFAIPGAMARDVLQEVLASGRVRRAEVGISVLPVAKLGRDSGALVASVDPGSAAEAAGIEPGDILLAVGGEPVTVRFFEEVPALYRLLAGLAVGAPVDLQVERSGKPRTVSLRPQEMEASQGAEAEVSGLGITVQEVTGPMAMRRQIEARSGLLVTSLRPGFPAADAHPAVEEGDLLTSVAGRPTRSIAELRAALEAAGSDQALLGLRRDDERLYAVARFDSTRSARRGGELPKAWLGVETQVVTPELARAMGAPDLRGFRVTEVLPWSEAEKAGLAVDDVLTAVDGEPLEAEREQDVENLRRTVEEHSIGDSVTLALVRGGAPRKLDVRLEPRPRSPSEAPTTRVDALGFVVREPTLFDRVENHWDRDQQGALVVEVVPGSWAQMAGLQPNDLILSLAGRDVRDLQGFRSRIDELLLAQPKVLEIFVRRGVRTHFVFLEPDWNHGEPTKEMPQ